MAPAIRNHAADVTVEWLTGVLRAAGVITDASVRSFETTPVGTGQMADSVRFRLAYDTGEALGAPASVVVKLAAADDTSRATGVALGSYETEVRFYRQVAPT